MWHRVRLLLGYRTQLMTVLNLSRVRCVARLALLVLVLRSEGVGLEMVSTTFRIRPADRDTSRKVVAHNWQRGGVGGDAALPLDWRGR